MIYNSGNDGIGQSVGNNIGNINSINNTSNAGNFHDVSDIKNVNNINNDKNAVIKSGVSDNIIDTNAGRVDKTVDTKKQGVNINEIIEKEPIIQTIMDMFDGELLK